jgi:hypothetical protein
MDDKELRKLLQELREEIKKSKAVDEKGRKLLNSLDKDIHDLLEIPENKPVQLHPTVVQRFREAREHFEVTHPGITANLSKLLNTLSTIGL